MAFWVYILRSETTGRYYCGQTDNVEKRLQQRNDPTNDSAKTTKRFRGPWELVGFRRVQAGKNTGRC